jgi:hypothetical protein
MDCSKEGKVFLPAKWPAGALHTAKTKYQNFETNIPE